MKAFWILLIVCVLWFAWLLTSSREQAPVSRPCKDLHDTHCALSPEQYKQMRKVLEWGPERKGGE